MFSPVALKQTRAEREGIWFETTNGYAFVVSPEDVDWVAMYADNWTGSEKGDIRAYNFSLHKKIMERTRIPKPCGESNLVDHRNGRRWDNMRTNLRWATHSQNGRNKAGVLHPGVSLSPSALKRGSKKPWRLVIEQTFTSEAEALDMARDIYSYLWGEWSPYFDHEAEPEVSLAIL